MTDVSIQSAVDELTDGSGVVVWDKFFPASTVETVRNVVAGYEVDRFNGVRGLLDKDDVFLEIVANEKLVSLAEALFGCEARLGSCDVKVNLPVAPATFADQTIRDHVDYPGTAQIGMLEGQQNPFSDTVFSLKAFIPFTDLNAQSGGTRYIPGSHKWFRNPELHPGEFEIRVERGEANLLEIEAGSVALWAGPIWHADLENGSGNDRLLMHVCYVPHFVATPHNMPKSYPSAFWDRCPEGVRRLCGV